MPKGNTRDPLVLRLTLHTIVLLLSFPLWVFAAEGINAQIPFAGVLKNSGGIPISGTIEMTFRIYDAANGGNVLWTGTHTQLNGNPVTVEEGNFTVMLGSGNGNELELNFNDDSYYLGITIGDDVEMIPRERLGASGYAINTDFLDGFDSVSFLLKDYPLQISTTSSETLFSLTQSGSGDIVHILSGANEVFTILNNGYIGVHDDTPTSALSVGGEVRASNFFSTSDALNIFSGSLNVLSTSTSLFEGGIQPGDGYGVLFGSESGGVTLFQNTALLGTNDIMFGLRGQSALDNGYVNIASPGTLSFTANAELDGSGTYTPSMEFKREGNVRIANFGQGDFEDQYLELDFANGVFIPRGDIRLGSGSYLGATEANPDAELFVEGPIKSSSLTSATIMGLSAAADGSIMLGAPSDEALKENIRTIDDALDTVLRLRGVRYEWRDKDRFGKEPEVGFVAQEVATILPEVVREGNGYVSLNIGNIVAVVVEGMKTLYDSLERNIVKTERLEQELEDLRVELRTLSDELDVPDRGENVVTPEPILEDPGIDENGPALYPEPPQQIPEEDVADIVEHTETMHVE